MLSWWSTLLEPAPPCLAFLSVTMSYNSPSMPSNLAYPGCCPPLTSPFIPRPILEPQSTPPQAELESKDSKDEMLLPSPLPLAVPPQSRVSTAPPFPAEAVSTKVEILAPFGAGNLITSSPKSHCIMTQGKERVSTLSPESSPHWVPHGPPKQPLLPACALLRFPFLYLQNSPLTTNKCLSITHTSAQLSLTSSRSPPGSLPGLT